MPEPIAWRHRVHEDGRLAYRMGVQGGRLVAEWPRLARLTCNGDGSRFRVEPVSGAARGSIDKLRGVVRALVTDVRGGLGVHASAVRLGTRAVLLLGNSGAGKSTAAAGLCLNYGGGLLADDAASLEQRGATIRAVPSEGEHYLSKASLEALGVRPRHARKRNGKTSVRPTTISRTAVPVSLVAWLRFDDSLTRLVARPLRGSDAVFRFLGSLFRFDVADRHQELDRVLRLYEQADFIDIARPRGAPDVTRYIASLVGASRHA